MAITIEEIKNKYVEYHQKETDRLIAENLRDREEAIPEVERIIECCLAAAECGDEYIDIEFISNIVLVILREKQFHHDTKYDVVKDRFVYRISGWGKQR
jgi:hypothetical protein